METGSGKVVKMMDGELLVGMFTNPLHTFQGPSGAGGSEGRRGELLRSIASLREEAETGTGRQSGQFDGMSLLQINLNHCAEVLVHKLTSRDINVALIQEPWIRGSQTRGLKVAGYQLYGGGG